MAAKLTFCYLAALMGVGSAGAASIPVTLQRGLDAYDGVEDLMLYAPSSVADVNYGRHDGLRAGINRWNERYVSLIRFDLSSRPGR